MSSVSLPSPPPSLSTSHRLSSSHYMNPMLSQFRKRVQLQRSMQPVLPSVIPPPVIKKNNNKKSVRFHEDDQVRYFLKCQCPNAVSLGDPPQDAVSANDYTLAMPNWPCRRSIYLNNSESKIRMESLILTEADDLKENKVLLEGRCRALNISYEKMVSVRYTFDLWSTFEETEAVYRDSIPTYGGANSPTWDRFSFYIPVTAANKNMTVYIALKYTVDNAEYWDNNNSKNYQADVSPKYPVAEEPETEDEEQVAAAVEEKEQEIVKTLSELDLNIDTTTSSMNTKEKLPLKVLGRRYDFTASLNAVRKPITSSPPMSPPGTPTDSEPLPYTPPVFFGGSSYMLQYASTVEKSLSPPAFDTFPTVSIPINKKQETTTIFNPPIGPTTTTEGYQMSYSDFVNKYCFYNSHSNPLYNNVYSTSPSAVHS